MPGHAVTIRNVSVGGAGVQTSKRLSPGSVVDLRLDVFGSRLTQRVVVIWSRVDRLDRAGPSFVAGLQFTSVCDWLPAEEFAATR
jgi:hypothetical protein